MEDNFSMDWGSGGVGGGDGSGSNARDGSVGNERDGERQMKLHSLAGSLFTSYCAARFLTGCGPVPVCSRGVGDPCSIGFKQDPESCNMILKMS